MTPGTKLRQYRQAAKLSQKEVAEHIRVDASTYGSWEADHTQMKSRYLVPLAGLFGVSVPELMPDELADHVAKPGQLLSPPANPASLTPDAETHYQEHISALKESNRDKDALLSNLQARIQRLETELKKYGWGGIIY
ncbi:MAG: helix-turn-helix domain-containing protein [Cytophagaceae bacterium]|nr:helix-turn-helix domain-containing protein [Cytophagaceae bacterium]